jgi:hypothetical protein
MKWQWRIESPFGPLIKWPNLHYPGVDEMPMPKIYKITYSNGKEPETVRSEGMRTAIRELKIGEHIDIERMPDPELTY